MSNFFSDILQKIKPTIPSFKAHVSNPYQSPVSNPYQATVSNPYQSTPTNPYQSVSNQPITTTQPDYSNPFVESIKPDYSNSFVNQINQQTATPVSAPKGSFQAITESGQKLSQQLQQKVSQPVGTFLTNTMQKEVVYPAAKGFLGEPLYKKIIEPKIPTGQETPEGKIIPALFTMTGKIAALTTLAKGFGVAASSIPTWQKILIHAPKVAQVIQTTAAGLTLDQLQEPLNQTLKERQKIFEIGIPQWLGFGIAGATPAKQVYTWLPSVFTGNYISSKLNGNNNQKAFKDALITSAVMSAFKLLELPKDPLTIAREQAAQVLGVQPNASQSEIKQSYYTLAHQYHPDMPTGDQVKFQQISTAYNLLSTTQPQFQSSVWSEIKDLYKYYQSPEGKGMALQLLREMPAGLSIKPIQPVPPEQPISKEKGIIPKELEPLAIEARKYASADDFFNAVNLAPDEQAKKWGFEVSKFGNRTPNLDKFNGGDLFDFFTQATKGITEVKPIPKELEPLAKEAGNIRVFRAGYKPELVNTDIGVSFSTSKDKIKPFGGKIEEFFLAKDTKILDYNNIPLEIRNHLKVGGGKGQLAMMDAVKYTKKQGYDAVDFRPLGLNEIRIINPDKIIQIKGIKEVKPIPTIAPEAQKPIIKAVEPTELINPLTKPPILPSISEIPQGDPVQKVIQALKEVKPIRGKQETLYAQERAKRLAKAMAVGKKVEGEAGLYAQLGQLKGELPKVEFESLKNKISQTDIDALFNMVEQSPMVSGFGKIAAKEGLLKLFSELGGRVPTEGEMILLGKVFPKEFIETLLEKRTLFTKITEAGYQLANMPRSIMSSFMDLSFGLRQGLFAAPRFRKEFFDSWKKQFSWFGSEKAFQENQKIISQNKYFELAQDSEIAFTEMDSVMGAREEKYMSQWAEKIPGVGKIVRMTGRAYTAFANKNRMDIFATLIEGAKNLGENPETNVDLAKQIANLVNEMTGRGKLPLGLEKSAKFLNSFFFSPRLMASRLKLLVPIEYIKAEPFVRKEYLKSLFSFAGTIATILALVKLAGGKVEDDMRSSDWGKIKIGNTRIDIMGGFQQYIRMTAQLITGKYISSTTGKEYTLGEGYKPLTRFDILLRQIESKEAPVASFITDILRQQDYAGQPINVLTEIGQRFTPMVIGDLIDLVKDDPKLLPIGALGIFGVGIQTYKEKPSNVGGLKFNFGEQKIQGISPLKFNFK